MMRSLIILALGCGIFAGCLGKATVIPREYFALSPALTVIHGEPLDKTLGVRPLSVAKPYTTPIVYKDTPHALAFRANQEWAERPGDTVTRALIDALAASGRFEDVGNAAEMAHPDYILTGELRSFIENRTVTPPTADIEARLEVREALGDRVLWADTLKFSEEIQGADAQALAAAMTLAIERLVESASKAITSAEPRIQE